MKASRHVLKGVCSFILSGETRKYAAFFVENSYGWYED
jgi:hypothetical protein